MKTLRLLIRLTLNDTIKREIVLERKTLLCTQVNYGVEAYNYACSVLYVYAERDLNDYVAFDYDTIDGFMFIVCLNGNYESVHISSITIFSPESPFDNEVLITLYDKNEFETIEYYINQL